MSQLALLLVNTSHPLSSVAVCNDVKSFTICNFEQPISNELYHSGIGMHGSIYWRREEGGFPYK